MYYSREILHSHICLAYISNIYKYNIIHLFIFIHFIEKRQLKLSIVHYLLKCICIHNICCFSFWFEHNVSGFPMREQASWAVHVRNIDFPNSVNTLVAIVLMLCSWSLQKRVAPESSNVWNRIACVLDSLAFKFDKWGLFSKIKQIKIISENV